MELEGIDFSSELHLNVSFKTKMSVVSGWDIQTTLRAELPTN